MSSWMVNKSSSAFSSRSRACSSDLVIDLAFRGCGVDYGVRRVAPFLKDLVAHNQHIRRHAQRAENIPQTDHFGARVRHQRLDHKEIQVAIDVGRSTSQTG